MVATLNPISSAENAGIYFYFTEKNYESSKGWHQNEVTKELGLTKITRERFEEILSGKINAETQLGRKTKEGLKHHPGQELILSAPKSVSIMALVAKDKRLLEAHEKAVATVLDYVQRHLIHTRVQNDKEQYNEKTNNALIAKYTHITSRGTKDGEKDKKPDPQIHTHTLFANATKCEDNEWRSIVFDKIYEHKMDLGELYRIELGRNTMNVGYEIATSKDRVGRFTFEIIGVPSKDIGEFSQRRKGILKTAKEEGVKSAKELAYIAKTTRKEKIRETRGELQKNWVSRASMPELKALKESAVSSVTTYTNLSFKGFENRNILEPTLNENLDFAIRHLSEREAVWDATTLHKTIWQREGVNSSIGKIESRIKKETESKSMLLPYDKNNNSYTTPKNLREEREVIKLLHKGRNSVKAIMSDKEVSAALKDTKLSVGQQDAVRLLLTTRDRMVGVQGLAGTGKTTMLQKVKELAETKDIELLGLAPTKAAVGVLKKTVGIEAKTLSAFITKYDGVIKGRGTEQGRIDMRSELSNKLIVLDEASLASTNSIKKLGILADTLKLRTPMMGDTKQQGGVEAGKPFYYLQDHGMTTAQMRDIKRQDNKELLQAVYAAEKAVDTADASKHIYQVLKLLGGKNIIDLSSAKDSDEDIKPNNENLAISCYKKWSELHAQGKKVLVVAPSNDLRDKINARIRKHFIKGESENHITYNNLRKTVAQISDIKEYKGTEQVVFNKAIKSLGIEKDDRFRIEGIGKQLIELKKDGDKKSIFWNPKEKSKYATLYEPKGIQIAKGEKIVWTRNSNKHSFIINGAAATVEKVGEKRIEIRTDAGEKKTLSKEEACYMDYGYSTTSYSSQGSTLDYVIGIARAKEHFLTLTHQRSFYVTLSRAKKEAYLIIDNYKNLIKSLGKKTGEKTSAIEHQTERKVILKEEKKENSEIKQQIRQKITELAKQYNDIEPILKKKGNLEDLNHKTKDELRVLSKNIAQVEKEFLDQKVYKAPEQTLQLWRKISIEHGKEKACEMVSKNPELLGELNGTRLFFIKDKLRKNAEANVNRVIEALVKKSLSEDNHKLKTKELETTTKSIEKELKSLLNMKPGNFFSSEGLERKTFGLVRIALKKISGLNVSIGTASAISKRFNEQIVEFRNKYKEEPTEKDKKNFFFRAKCEIERQGFYKEELQKRKPPKTISEKLKRIDTIEKLSKIDYNLASERGSFTPSNTNDVFSKYKDITIRATELTKSYLQQGMSFVKANLMASKIINHELSYGNAPSLRKTGEFENMADKSQQMYKTTRTELKLGNLETSVICNKISENEYQDRMQQQEIYKERSQETGKQSSTESNKSQTTQPTKEKAVETKIDRSMGIEI